MAICPLLFAGCEPRPLENNIDGLDHIDNISPIPGGSGALVVSDISVESLILSWTKAADDRDQTADLEYMLVQSLRTDNIDSVSEATTDPDVKILMNWVKAPDASLDVDDLSADTVYYFNALVRDGRNNTAIYNATAAIIKGLTIGAGGTSYSLLNGALKTWGGG